MAKVRHKVRPRLAILASGDRKTGGGGSTMEQLIRDSQNAVLNAEIVLVVCNNPPGTVAVYDRIERLNAEFGLKIKILTINQFSHPGGQQARGQTLQESAAIVRALEQHRIDFVICLGYMKQLNGSLIKKYGWLPDYAKQDPEHRGIYHARLANTHPGILPATADTYGLRASERALELGLTETAATLHVIASGIDEGPVIAKTPVPIIKGETAEQIFANVQSAEKANLGRMLNDHLQARANFMAAQKPVD